jgi:hypothetical protein
MKVDQLLSTETRQLFMHVEMLKYSESMNHINLHFVALLRWRMRQMNVAPTAHFKFNFWVTPSSKELPGRFQKDTINVPNTSFRFRIVNYRAI